MSTDAVGAPRSHASWGDILRPVLGPPAAIAIAILVGAALVTALGQNPIDVYTTLIQGSLVGWPNLSVALQMTTPLIFTGLAVALSFLAAFWDIGAEGHMLVGPLAAGISAFALPLPPILPPPTSPPPPLFPV